MAHTTELKVEGFEKVFLFHNGGFASGDVSIRAWRKFVEYGLSKPDIDVRIPVEVFLAASKKAAIERVKSEVISLLEDMA